MSSTTQTHGSAVSDLITSMTQAIENAARLGPVPPRQFKIHPDDFDDLLLQCTGQQTTFASGSEKNQFLGVDLVLDEDAPRLPRRAAT